MQKAQNLKAAMLQGQIQQQQLQDAQDFRQQYGVSPGMAKHVSEMATAQKNAETAKVQFQNELIKRDQNERDAVRGLLQTVGNSSQSLLAGLQGGNIPPQELPQAYASTLMGIAGTDLQPKPGDTEYITAKKEKIRQGMTQDLANLAQMPPEAIVARLQQHVGDAKTHEEWVKELSKPEKQPKEGPFETALNLYNQGKDVAVPATDKGFISWYTQLAHPKAASSVGPLDPGAAGQNSQVYAERLVKGLEPWPSTTTLRTDPVIRQGLQLARQMDPDFNASTHKQREQTTKAFTTGKPADTINALNTGMGHLGELSDLAEKLNNSSIKGYNTVANWVQKNTGDPIVTSFQTTKKAVADEVTRVWRGTGGSEKDVQEALSNLSEDLAPAQLRANIYQLTKLMASKQKALEDQYQKGMGRFGDLQVLNDEARAALGKIQERVGGKGTDATGPSQSYKGKSLPTAVFNQLSEADKKKFTAGGGRID